ncbi:MAG TPA: pilus assembly protein CpaF, partial [Isosphaeraceae bacterium]|nr:pilus assembly protein CpaF [Isosphaeraceae bacterium]
AEEVLNLPVSWQIPNASKEFTSARARGVPLAAVAPKSSALRAIQGMVKSFDGAPEGERTVPRLSRFAASFF